MSYTPRLREKYSAEIVPALTEKFGYKTVMKVPKLQKIVISQGVGDAVADKKLIDNAVADVTLITGQKAIATLSKKDISNFKLRKGMPIGTKVTLRGDRMYDFLDRLLSVALPRTRDFRESTLKVLMEEVTLIWVLKSISSFQKLILTK